jgi:hypothetical protein
MSGAEERERGGKVDPRSIEQMLKREAWRNAREGLDVAKRVRSLKGQV